MEPRAPSGLFPARSTRPSYREPHPVRMAPLLAAVALTAMWLIVFGLLGRSTGGYVWWTALAAGVAWVTAFVLARFGDRGAAVGVAITAGIGICVAFGVTMYEWATVGWPLW